MDIGRAYLSGGIVPSGNVPIPLDPPGERRISACAQDAEPVKNGSPTGSALPAPVLEDYLTRLIAALADTAKQLSRAADSMQAMAQSNQALIAAMAEADGMDDMPATTYMDGSSVR